MTDLTLLLSMFDEAFDARSWHGATLRGSLRGLTSREASWRPAASRHNVWEVVLHCAYWKYAVRQRLAGGTRGSFALAGSNWFERPARGYDGEKAWRADVALLVAEHRQLRDVVSRTTPDRLHRPIGKSRLSPAFLIRGIAAHDLYHAGQIQLLKRLARGSDRHGRTRG